MITVTLLFATYTLIGTECVGQYEFGPLPDHVSVDCAHIEPLAQNAILPPAGAVAVKVNGAVYPACKLIKVEHILDESNLFLYCQQTHDRGSRQAKNLSIAPGPNVP